MEGGEGRLGVGDPHILTGDPHIIYGGFVYTVSELTVCFFICYVHVPCEKSEALVKQSRSKSISITNLAPGKIIHSANSLILNRRIAQSWQFVLYERIACPFVCYA